MANLEDRISELERSVLAILSELGGLEIRLSHMDSVLGGAVSRIETKLNNMGQNTADIHRRLVALEHNGSDGSNDQ